jgi:hypothetical protein
MGKRSTNAVVRQRVEEIYRLRLGGAEYHDLLQHASEQGWGVTARQVGNYIAAADKLMAERLERRAEVLLSRHLLQRRQLYAHALGAGDFRTALAVLDSEARLERLEPCPRLLAR